MQESPFILKRSIGEEHYNVESATWSIYNDESLKKNNLCIYIQGLDLLKAPANWEKEDYERTLANENEIRSLNAAIEGNGALSDAEITKLQAKVDALLSKNKSIQVSVYCNRRDYR